MVAGTECRFFNVRVDANKAMGGSRSSHSASYGQAQSVVRRVVVWTAKSDDHREANRSHNFQIKVARAQPP